MTNPTDSHNSNDREPEPDRYRMNPLRELRNRIEADRRGEIILQQQIIVKLQSFESGQYLSKDAP